MEERGPEYWKRMSEEADRHEAEQLRFVHQFAAGDRVMSKATRALGTVDRVLPTGKLIIITDGGQTCCDHPGHAEFLPKPRLTAQDILFLRSMRVGLIASPSTDQECRLK